jgi:hypothetical protein
VRELALELPLLDNCLPRLDGYFTSIGGALPVVRQTVTKRLPPVTLGGILVATKRGGLPYVQEVLPVQRAHLARVNSFVSSLGAGYSELEVDFALIDFGLASVSFRDAVAMLLVQRNLC